MLNSITTVLGRINQAAIRICTTAAACCLAMMTAIILIQVLYRYVLNAPLSWPEEAARFLMVWMAFLAAPYAYRHGLFVRLESLNGRFPKRIRLALDTTAHMIAIAVFVVLFRESLWLVERGMRVRASAINIPMAWVFGVMPVAFALLVSVASELILLSSHQQTRNAETTQ